MVGRGESTGDRQRDKCSKATTNHGTLSSQTTERMVWFVGTPGDLI